MSTNEGVCGHSSITGQNSYVIFCVGQSVVKQAQIYAWAQAQSHGIKKIIGQYKGCAETAFVMNKAVFMEHVMPAGWVEEEESILVLGPQDARGRRRASLWYLNPSHHLRVSEDLGLFQSVPKREALKHESWSYDPTQQEYFICKKEDEHVRRTNRSVQRPEVLPGTDVKSVPVAA